MPPLGSIMQTPMTPRQRPQGGPGRAVLAEFLTKLLRLAALRLGDLCDRLSFSPLDRADILSQVRLRGHMFCTHKLLVATCMTLHALSQWQSDEAERACGSCLAAGVGCFNASLQALVLRRRPGCRRTPWCIMWSTSTPRCCSTATWTSCCWAPCTAPARYVINMRAAAQGPMLKPWLSSC